MNCLMCDSPTNDGVQCSVCKHHLCFSCGGISEAGYRKLGSDRRASWKCPQCKLTPTAATSPKKPTTPTTDPASIELVLTELRDMKRQIANLCTVVDEFKELKKEISELKASCEYSSAKLDDYDEKFSSMDRRIGEISSLQDIVTSIQNTTTGRKANVEKMEQWTRLSNVEIRGVPLKKIENLFTIAENIGKSTGYQILRSQINYISRVPTYSKNKNIIISFINRYVKEEFIAAAPAFKELKASDIGFSNDTPRIFVNDHLTPTSKILLSKAKQKANDLGYCYKWVKYGKIHIRKNDTSPVVIISKDSDLSKII
ncbi:uncharacterized protein LOC113237724 [Hyposmocoma kahamanoa]|uniref:uncharacterized protein LOC113237724 n=1 Tax=Hyposmocoma kahamanoa TaxID=1477025 RepID=UPI000E6D6523|nr:uncharacterized protein LOC113237724 [Hyposmocoma kahamanoa]